MKYEQPSPMSRSELDEIFRGDKGEQIRDALISATYSEDPSWLLDWCLKLAGDQRSAVRYGVAGVLGHIAIHSRCEIDLKACLEATERLTRDLDDATRASARDSLEDVLHAMRLVRAAQS